VLAKEWRKRSTSEVEIECREQQQQRGSKWWSPGFRTARKGNGLTVCSRAETRLSLRNECPYRVCLCSAIDTQTNTTNIFHQHQSRSEVMALAVAECSCISKIFSLLHRPKVLSQGSESMLQRLAAAYEEKRKRLCLRRAAGSVQLWTRSEAICQSSGKDPYIWPASWVSQPSPQVCRGGNEKQPPNCESQLEGTPAEQHHRRPEWLDR
jgi:hypothetical protein